MLFENREPCMVTLYDYLDSGNGYKVRLLLALLEQHYRWVELDIMQGQTRTSEFLAKNANGRIPMLELEDGTCIAESNAISGIWAKARHSFRKTDSRAHRCCN